MQNEWMKKLIESFEYKKFLSLIKTPKFEEIIHRYKIMDNVILECDNNYNKVIEEIMPIFEEKYLNDVNNKSQIDYFLNNMNYYNKLYELKPNYKQIDSKKIYYYNNITIISNKIKNLINELFEIDIGKETNILFGDKKIIMESKDENQMSINIGKYENNIFISEILLDFKNDIFLQKCFLKINKEGYLNIINNLFYNDKMISLLKLDEEEIGMAYKINLQFNNEQSLLPSSISKKKDNNQEINKTDINENSTNNNETNSEIINQNIINNSTENSNDKINEINNGNQNDNTKKFQDKILKEGTTNTNVNRSNQSLEYNNNIVNISDNKSDVEENMNYPKKEEIKLSEFIEKEIKTLISYYIFYFRLKEDISNFYEKDEFDCYLINENLINKYKTFYLYEKLSENIAKIVKKKILTKMIKKLIKKYIKNYSMMNIIIIC